jgi:hypothetical protein
VGITVCLANSKVTGGRGRGTGGMVKDSRAIDSNTDVDDGARDILVTKTSLVANQVRWPSRRIVAPFLLLWSPRLPRVLQDPSIKMALVTKSVIKLSLREKESNISKYDAPLSLNGSPVGKSAVMLFEATATM